MGLRIVRGPAADCAPTKGPAFMTEACWAEGSLLNPPPVQGLVRQKTEVVVFSFDQVIKWCGCVM